MSAVKILSETARTVTLSRGAFEALLRAADDRADLAAVASHRAYEHEVGWETARRNYLTREETERLLDGERPVRIWRNKRGMTQRALAAAARVNVSYLAQIESGNKPGSAAALQRLARALEIPMEWLVSP